MNDEPSENVAAIAAANEMTAAPEVEAGIAAVPKANPDSMKESFHQPRRMTHHPQRIPPQPTQLIH